MMRPGDGTAVLQAPLGWVGFIRLGLVQAAIGAIVVFATSSLGRIMVVEYHLPAVVPGALVALHYAVQVLRPRWGFGSDVGARRTPWIIGGMALLAAGNIGAAIAVITCPANMPLALAVALTAYLAIGIGVGAAGTSLLALLATRVRPAHRAPAATLVWMMMIAGFIATAAFAGTTLDPFSALRLPIVAAAISATAFSVTILAVWNIEPRATPATAPAAASRPAEHFVAALREVWAEPQARRFTLFVLLSMLAYSAQELILEPFAGLVLGLTPGASAKLAGLQHTGLLAGMILYAVVGHRFADRPLGAVRFWTTGGCLGSAGAAIAIAAAGLAGTSGALRPIVFVLGMANGAASIAAIGAMMQLAAARQDGRAGTRMGVFGAAQAIAFACGGLAASGASDVARHLMQSPLHAYAIVFLGEAAVFLIAAAIAGAVFAPERRAATAREPDHAVSYEGSLS